MNENQSSITALASAFGRAYHFENDYPKIFSDSAARSLMTEAEYQLMSGHMAGGLSFFAPEKQLEFSDPRDALKWVVQTQISPTPLARAKYCEDMLENAVKFGARQYVILGAGMDTFAYRSEGAMRAISVFEVDHLDTQIFKKQKVAEAGLHVPDNLSYVAMDLRKDDIKEELRKANFNFRQRTFFSLLGVTYYLAKEDFADLLCSISAFVPEGSSIVFDYGDEHMFDSSIRRVQNMIAIAKAGGEPMQACYSYAELEKLLENTGWLIYEQLCPTDIELRFFMNRSDYLHAFEHVNFALAVMRARGAAEK